MPVIVVRNERTLRDLRDRLLGPDGPREVPEQVVDAIRRANPGIDLDNLRPGMVLRVPGADEVGADVAAAPADLLGEGLEAMVRELAELVERISGHAEGQARGQAVNRERVREVLGLRPVRDAAERDEQFRANVARVQEGVELAEQSAQRAEELRQQTVAVWSEDLEVIRALQQ